MKKTLSLLMSLLLLMTLCACGSSAKGSQASGADSTHVFSSYAADVAAEAPAAAYDYDEYAEEEMTAFGGFAAETAAPTVQGTGNSAATSLQPEKIIYSANAQLETTTFDDTVAAIGRMIESFGGFVENSSVNGANYYNRARGYAYLRSASFTIRVPGENFRAMMDTLPTLGNVPYTNTYTENVTSQYYDVQARLKAYQAQEERLIEMMSVAETVEDIITIEDRLTEIRYEIDSMQSRLNNWDRKVSFSTIYLDVSEVEAYTPTESVKVTYGQKLAAAVKNGLKTVGDFFSDFLLWFLEALPTLILLAVLALVIILIIRRCRKGNAARREKKARKAMPSEPAAPSAPDPSQEKK